MVTLLSDEQSLVQVPLKELHSLQEAHISGAELVLRPLREAQVTSLMMADPASLPAIVLTRTQEYGLLIVDGYHRQEAAKRRKLSEIRADIRAFASENALIEAAFQANLVHGLPTSATTRSDYAYWLWRTYPEMKQIEIARRVGLRPPTVNTAIRRRERERLAAETEQKRQASLIGWHKEDKEREEREQAEEQQLVQIIRAYVRQSRRLYERLRRLDDDGARYWALEKVIAEGDKVTLARMCQYIEHYIKESLPPDLVKSLTPTTSRSRRTKQSASSETEASSPEKEQ